VSNGIGGDSGRAEERDGGDCAPDVGRPLFRLGGLLIAACQDSRSGCADGTFGLLAKLVQLVEA
jgi:hypothetical protein